MEQQCAETGKQQRGGNVKSGQCGDEHGRAAEHGEHVLQTEDEHARSAKLARASKMDRQWFSCLSFNLPLSVDFLIEFITSGIAACYRIELVIVDRHEVHARLAVELRQANLDKLACEVGMFLPT